MSDSTTGDLAFVDWTEQLSDQLRWHWENHLRPRLEGLTDEEYFWEPVPGCWSVRPRGECTAPIAAGSGPLVADFEIPEPVPPPVTTIAWRIAHLLVGIFGARNASHFGGPPVDYMTAEWPSTADEALARLDTEYERWIGAVSALDDDGLARPVGEAEGPFAESPMAALVLHIHRETIHHGAEICLLRDLYRASGGAAIS
jgi:DinB superfamily